MKNRKLIPVVITILILSSITWFFTRKPKIQNVLLISIDTCRADYLSCYGYKQITTPNIDSIAKTGILFENVVAPVPMTLPSHSSMLTGTIPVYHGVHDNVDYQLGQSNITLAEILMDAGFTTGAAISALVLDSQFGIDQGFEIFDDHFKSPAENNLIEQRRGDETTKICLDWLDENKDKRFFFFLHYFDPHKEYKSPEPFASLFIQNPYAGEIAYTDHCIGQVIQKLKNLDLYDSTLIIITSDHGEMLGEHGEPTHAYFIYESAIKVPLVFKIPGWNKAVRIKQLAGLIDIVPTVCSLLDIKPPAVVQGVDLSDCFSGRELSADRGLCCESLQPTTYGANSLLGIVTDSFKYIQTTRPELYNLINDPTESNNLISWQLDRARILKDRLARMIQQSVRGDSEDSRAELDDETRRRLESLGYVGGGVVEDFDFDQTKDDPKDVLNFHLLSGKIAGALVLKQYDLAKQMAEEMIRMRPDCATGYQNAGQVAHKQGDHFSAAAYFQQALKLKPDSFKTRNNLGLALESLGKLAEAVEHYQKALTLKPDYAEAHHNLAIALESLGKHAQAVEHYQKVLKFNPDYTNIHYNLGNTLMALGKPAEALEHYQQALNVNPDHAETYYSLGNVIFFMGKLSEAISHYQKALELKPGMEGAYNNLGNALMALGKPAEAISHYQKALEIKPDMADAHYNLGIALEKIGKIAEAVEHYLQALKLKPDVAIIHYDLAAALLKQNKVAKTIVHWKEVLRLNPDHIESHNNLAWVLATVEDENLRDPAQALTLAQKACELTKYKQPTLLDTLAVAYAAKGDFPKAIETAQKAIDLAASAGNKNLTEQIQKRLTLYNNNQPYTEH